MFVLGSFAPPKSIGGLAAKWNILLYLESGGVSYSTRSNSVSPLLGAGEGEGFPLRFLCSVL